LFYGYNSGALQIKDDAFQRGELKIGLRSHNTTMFYKMYAYAGGGTLLREGAAEGAGEERASHL